MLQLLLGVLVVPGLVARFAALAKCVAVAISRPVLLVAGAAILLPRRWLPLTLSCGLPLAHASRPLLHEGQLSTHCCVRCRLDSILHRLESPCHILNLEGGQIE